MHKVMIVDDDPGVVEVVKAVLRDDKRYQLIIARNGADAVAVASEEKPDLVFLDIRMPKMDGYSVLQRIKRDPRTTHTKVVMLTSEAQDADMQKAIKLGADGYFTKPFSPTALLKKVDAVLGMS